jgi:arylformamidase
VPQLIDISQPLDRATAAWPGDRELTLEWTMRRDRGDSVDVAAITMSVHTGTHADGPAHTGEGPAVGELALEPFIGPAVVVDARPSIAGDPPLVGSGALQAVDVAVTPRVLLRTRDRTDPGRFPEPFAALSPALVQALMDRGAVLVGTDAPSVDPVDSTSLEAHRMLSRGGIMNLENLVLEGVEPGRYTLVALPLRLSEADSSPVRAVLLPEGAL